MRLALRAAPGARRKSNRARQWPARRCSSSGGRWRRAARLLWLTPPPAGPGARPLWCQPAGSRAGPCPTSPRRAWWASVRPVRPPVPASASRASTMRACSAAPPLLEQAPVGHLVGQGVLEGVPGRGRGVSHTGIRPPGDGLGRGAGCLRTARRWYTPRGNGDLMANDGRRLRAARFASGGSRSMRAARTACTVAGTWMLGRRLRQAVSPPLAHQHLRLHQGSRSPPGRTGCPRCARSAGF